jgi:glycosyltransferase involved in cell wall biosynthesis
VRILILVSYYHPGFKAGGPIRTLASMVEHLGDSFEFWIITGDRDYKDQDSFDNVPLNRWVSVGKAQVYYTEIKSLSLSKLNALIDGVNPDVVYLNSILSPLANKYLLARRLRMISNIPTLAAPRGIFSSGALQIKRFKKRAYLFAAQGTGLFKGLHWQASSMAEKKDICTILPGVEGKKIFVAPDIPPMVKNNDVEGYLESSQKPVKEIGQVRFIFLSRITPVKNLQFALALLRSIEGHIKFDLFGPVQDLPYWENCQEIIGSLPPNVQVQYHGPVPNEEVRKLFSNAHFFILPTLGENFGHAILESLTAGCPVIVSDRTPWDDLSEVKAGWVVALENQGLWIDILQTCVDMDQGEYSTYSINAGQYAQRQLSSPLVLQANQDMFLNMID